MYEIYLVPSVYAHIMNGLLLFISLILIYRNYSTLSRLAGYEKVKLILLISIAIGLHGLSHMGLEYIYKYNPLKTASTSK
jgi:hypothetical protein